MKNKLSILAVIAFCLLFFGMTTNAQIYAINTTFYIQSSIVGPFTLQVAIERYDGTYYDLSSLTTGGPYYSGTAYSLPSPWPFPDIPWPVSPPVTNYCRVWMYATRNGTTNPGHSGWLSPDNNGWVYPGLIIIPF